MLKYKGIKCPACEKEFTETDDIVVCPECGAPYHKECAKNGCILTKLHEKGETWQPEEKKEAKFDGNLPKRCSRCGTANPTEKLHCEVCGTPLINETETPKEDNPYNYIPFNPFINPLGGVGADEEISSVPVKDLALLVKENTHYYIPRFKSVATTKKGGFNWSAFLFNIYFFIYRKMWGMAILAFIISAILSIPSMFYLYEYIEALYLGLDIPEIPDKIYFAMQVCSYMSLAIRLLYGIFANRIYATICFKKAKKLRKRYGEKPDYSTILSAKGGTSKVALIIFIALPYLLSILMTIITSFLFI